MDILSIPSYRELDGPMDHNTYRGWKDGFWSAYKTFWEDRQNELPSGGIDFVISAFISFWHEELDEMDFIQYFISPELRWKYKEELSIMNEDGSRAYVDIIVKDIESRLSFEFLIEAGLLVYLRIPYEADNVLFIAFQRSDLYDATTSLISQLYNQPKTAEEGQYSAFVGMVVGFLMMVKLDGCFSKVRDKEKYCEYLLKYWPDENKNDVDPELVLECMLKAVSRLVCPYPFADKSEADSFIIDTKNAYLSVDRLPYRCESCGRIHYIAYENMELINNMICLSPGCKGKLERFSER